jgi:hypothetical protein
MWFDGEIKPGEEWEKSIFEALNKADIILLLISADFISSDYCYDVEMKKAIDRHENGEAIVIPVILSHCDWTETPFSKLQALPKDGVPIVDSKWYTEDQAMADVAINIRSVVARKIKEREDRLSNYFQEIDSLKEERERLLLELRASRKERKELEAKIEQRPEAELLKAIEEKKIELYKKDIIIHELKSKLSQYIERPTDTDTLVSEKKAKIINTGALYTTIDGNREFDWKNEEIMKKAGRAEWKKSGFAPKTGMIGEIVDSFKHVRSDALIYVLYVDEKYYVPIGASGVKLLN